MHECVCITCAHGILFAHLLNTLPDTEECGFFFFSFFAAVASAAFSLIFLRF